MTRLDRLTSLATSLKAPATSDDEIFHMILGQLESISNVGELARKFGMSRSTISRWKNGHSVPHPALRPRIYRWLRSCVQARINELQEQAEDQDEAARQQLA